LATNVREIYYYGETTEGTHLVWEGDYPRTVGNKTLNMRKVADADSEGAMAIEMALAEIRRQRGESLLADSDGVIDWVLTCPQ
jgi:hypothetical protein